jgi:hypothetical protein|tara:strand:+ start:2329 stop:3390 length:1062 start_codon:yes stop_codon:yes gene_type:complete
MPSLMTPNNDFSFDDVTLSSPIIMSGGTHFIKYNIKGEPMYIQPPKALVKQSIIKSQKRMYCDLLFTNEHEDFLSWIENLEEHSKKYIFNQRDKWFETDLEETDIDNTFTSVLKPYKSGKYYILRVYIPVHLGNVSLKIYDENENTVPIEDIKENQCVRCALDFKGIKCSPRNFQVDIELKQILLMEEEKIFETCILKKSESKKALEKENVKSLEKEDNLEQEESVSIIETPEEEEIPKEEEEEEIPKEEEEEIPKEEEEDISKEEDDTIVLEESLEPVEFDFNSDSINDEETVSIKKPNAIYYEMYKEALKKAKMAKELALASYLEAKNIKNTYMLDDLDDSDLEEESMDDI